MLVVKILVIVYITNYFIYMNIFIYIVYLNDLFNYTIVFIN